MLRQAILYYFDIKNTVIFWNMQVANVDPNAGIHFSSVIVIGFIEHSWDPTIADSGLPQ
jgi:hypothetical protein